MRNEVILIAGCEPWGHWRQTHNIAYIWARENKVVFVDTELRYENIRRQKGRLGYLKAFWKQEIKWVAENIAVLETPPMLPVAVSFLSRKWPAQIEQLSIRLSKILQARIILNRLKKLGLSPTVLSVWRPFDLLLAGRMGERVACWHLFDEVSRFSGQKAAADLIRRVEQENINRIQLVFAASQKLYENKKALHPKVYLIPNAGDFKMFNRAVTEDLPEPEDLRCILRPRLVLIGALGWDSIDYKLLSYIADTHPEWSIVLIGLVRSSGKEGVEDVLQRPNGYSLGYKPQPELPAYLKYCDCGLMPYKIAGSIIDGYPLKMHEYLAAGIPVVSVPQPAVLAFSDVVDIARDKTDFVSLVEKALTDKSSDKKKHRIAVACANSWEKRVEEMNALIKTLL